MKKLLGNVQVAGVLLIAVLSSPIHAHFIANDESEDRQRLTRFSPSQVQQIAAPLFQFTPLQASEKGGLPAISDPLGLNSDPSIRLFSGVVQNSDLFEDFRVMKYAIHQDVELPVGIVRQHTLITNYVNRFFTGELRAADRSLTRLEDTGHRTWMGLPTTDETAPLTLAGFGSVGEFIRPRPIIWILCDGVEKRMSAIANGKKNRQSRKKRPPVPPSYCFDI